MVEDVDRDRAAAFMYECGPLLGSTCMTVSVELALRQAMSRHRLAAAKATQEACAKVALNFYIAPKPTSRAAQYHERNVKAIIHDAIRALVPGETP